MSYDQITNFARTKFVGIGILRALVWLGTLPGQLWGLSECFHFTLALLLLPNSPISKCRGVAWCHLFS